MNLEILRKDFPILERQIRQKKLVYFDNAATTQKPHQVIQAMNQFYTNSNANVHRGAYRLSEEATQQYEAVRDKVLTHLGLPSIASGGKPQQVIFTSGATGALNLVASTWGRKWVQKGDEILVSRMEHHSNFVPWQQLAKEKEAKFTIIELTPDYRLDLERLKKAIARKPRILALTWMSNVLGTINPIMQIAKWAHEAGVCFCVDATQAVAHLPMDLKNVQGIDFLAFSAHKMCGPTGVGVLWAQEHRLNEMPPYQYGGDMILQVRDADTVWNDLPWRFEAGTPNFTGVIGFGAALDYLQSKGIEALAVAESELAGYALERLKEVKGLRLIGPDVMNERGGVFSFLLEGVHPHDLATLLDSEGIAIRGGHHCAQPLVNKLGLMATARMSLYMYNTRDEVDFFVKTLEKARKYFGVT